MTAPSVFISYNHDSTEHVDRVLAFANRLVAEGIDVSGSIRTSPSRRLFFCEIINEALEAIKDANKEKLEGVFRNIDFNSEANLGRTKKRNERLKNLLNNFNDISI